MSPSRHGFVIRKPKVRQIAEPNSAGSAAVLRFERLPRRVLAFGGADKRNAFSWGTRCVQVKAAQPFHYQGHNVQASLVCLEAG